MLQGIAEMVWKQARNAALAGLLVGSACALSLIRLQRFLCYACSTFFDTLPASVRGASGPRKGLKAHLKVDLHLHLLSARIADSGRSNERRPHGSRIIGLSATTPRTP